MELFLVLTKEEQVEQILAVEAVQLTETLTQVVLVALVV
jgi:hypothetical protein